MTDPVARPTPPSASPARSLAHLGVVLVTGTALLAAGDALPPPPLSWRGLPRWLDAREPAAAAASVLRCVALVAVAYLAVLTGLGLLSRLDPRAAQVSRRLPRWLGRRVVERAVGVSLATGIGVALAPTAAMAEPAPASSTVTTEVPRDEPVDAPAERALMIPLPEDAVTDPDAQNDPRTADTTASDQGDPAPATGEATVTMISVDEDQAPAEPTNPAPSEGPGPTTTPPTSDPAIPVPTQHADGEDGTVDPAEASGGTTHDTSTWQVALGDHLWAIAAETLADAEVAHDDDAVLAYWIRLVDTNRDRLVDPDNPDLVYPGQELRLPAINVGSG